MSDEAMFELFHHIYSYMQVSRDGLVQELSEPVVYMYLVMLCFLRFS